MAEAYAYRRENVTDSNGNVIDSALFHVRRGNGPGRADFANAEYRGASRGGRVRNYIRSAAGRGAARNPVMRNNRYGF